MTFKLSKTILENGSCSSINYQAMCHALASLDHVSCAASLTYFQFYPIPMLHLLRNRVGDWFLLWGVECCSSVVYFAGGNWFAS